MTKRNKTLATLAATSPLALVWCAAPVQAARPEVARPDAAPAQTNQLAAEALAWCTAPNAYGVRCDGPTQATEVRDTLSNSLRYVGCATPRDSISWGEGRLYFCGRELNSWDRDIRARYGVKRY